jgi:hypothetical protein
MHGLTALAFALALLSACAAPAPSPPPQSAAPTDVAGSVTPLASPSPEGDPRVNGWRSDIRLVVRQIEALHPNVDQQVPIAGFETAANSLSMQVPALSDDELLDGIIRLAAMVGAKGCDAHTGAFVWGGGGYALDSMPLRLWLFGNDVYIVDALSPYKGLIGQSVTQIAGRATKEVIALVDPLVPRDNEQTVRLLLPRYLLIPQVLRGLGLAADTTVGLETQNGAGVMTETQIEPVSMSDYNDWAGAYGLHLPVDPGVLYLSRMDERLWSQPLPGDELYVQYNEMLTAPLGDLQTELAKPHPDFAVLDLRHNFGGEVSTVDPMVALFTDWLAADRFHHLYVATARNTFSAASLLVARLAGLPGVDVIGEAMGGCPSAYGNSRAITLSYSAIQVSVATSLEIGVEPDDTRETIQPDIPAELTFNDWQHKVDPVLDALTPGGV